MEIILKKSDRKNKKYMAIIDNKKIHFGDSRYEDLTTHKDEKRKELYINRHKKNEDWNNYLTAGFYAKNILWNKPTLEDSINDTNNKYNLQIKLNK